MDNNNPAFLKERQITIFKARAVAVADAVMKMRRSKFKWSKLLAVPIVSLQSFRETFPNGHSCDRCSLTQVLG